MDEYRRKQLAEGIVTGIFIAIVCLVFVVAGWPDTGLVLGILVGAFGGFVLLTIAAEKLVYRLLTWRQKRHNK